MAENSTFDNGAINNLYLTNGITEDGLSYFIITINFGHYNIMLPLVIITLLYIITKLSIKMHVEECWYCTDPTPTGTMCEQSKTKKVRFCRIIERWTVWLLVDVFRTPYVRKEMDNSKVHLKLWEKRTVVVGEKLLKSAGLFACISFIFCLYIEKFLVDFFQKLTPTCISKGDFGIPAVCYALDTSHVDNSSTSHTSYQINCTTWNDNLESLGEEIGLLFCFSFYYNILTSVTEMMGLFGLQTVVVQVTLIIEEKCTRLVDKYTQRMREENKMNMQSCMAIIVFIITCVGYIFISAIIPLLIEITDPTNKKRFHEVMYQQLLPTQMALLSMILALLLMIITAKDDETTEETRNMREHNEEPLEEHQVPLEEHQVPLEEHQGPLEEHQGPLEEHQVPLEEHQRPLEEHQGPLEVETPM